MKHKIIEALGWYGALAIMSAYFLVSFQIVVVDNTWYQLLNITGAASLIADTYSKKDYQPMILNVFWLLIALFALIGILIN